MERRWAVALAGAVALVVTVGAVRGLRAGQGASTAQVAATSAKPGKEAPVRSAPKAAPAEAPAVVPAKAEEPGAKGAPPRSLRGTEVDGALRVGADGELILGPEIITLFDYFLSATGEESASSLRARIVAEIRARVSGPAAEEATLLLDRYLAFREAARTMRMAQGEADDPEARLAAIRDLRRAHFGDDAEALFGDEEREGAVAAARSRIARDPTLTPEERQAQMEALSDELPEPVQKAHERAIQPLVQQAEERALRAAGASDEELYEHRVATVGEEAAERLAELDQRRAAWKARVEAFRAARERGGDEEALLEASFTPEERLRVRAILGLTARGGAP